MSRQSNRDIRSIIERWRQGKPVREIAKYHQVTRRRIYQIISFYRKDGFHPYLRKPGRRPEEISQETESIVLDSHDACALGPTFLEKKIEEIYTLHIPHNIIYRIPLQHDRVKTCMKKRKQRRWVRYEREHAMSLWRGDWKQIRRAERRRSPSHSWTTPPV